MNRIAKDPREQFYRYLENRYLGRKIEPTVVAAIKADAERILEPLLGFAVDIEVSMVRNDISLKVTRRIDTPKKDVVSSVNAPYGTDAAPRKPNDTGCSCDTGCGDPYCCK